MKYEVTFSCGHTGIVELFGKTSTREWRLKQIENELCENCLAEERRKQNEAAAEESRDYGFPELSGSEKQVAWANTIRLAWYESFCKKAESRIERYAKNGNDSGAAECKKMYEELTDYIIANALEAKEWIESRAYFGDFERKYKDSYREQRKEAEATTYAQVNAEEEATMKPENDMMPGVVEIAVDEKSVKATYIKDDGFRKIIKPIGFSWDGNLGKWVLHKSFKTGLLQDRAAELANALLHSGYTVRCWDSEVRRKALTADFTVMPKRWVYHIGSGAYKGWLALDYEGYDDALYQAGRKIKGSRYSNGHIRLPIQSWAEALDFAEIYGFGVSEVAMGAIEKYKAAQFSDPAAPKNEEVKDKLAEILESSTEVLPDLVDE